MHAKAHYVARQGGPPQHREHSMKNYAPGTDHPQKSRLRGQVQVARACPARGTCLDDLDSVPLEAHAGGVLGRVAVEAAHDGSHAGLRDAEAARMGNVRAYGSVDGILSGFCSRV